MTNIFSNQTTLDGLLSFSSYNVMVTAFNVYTPQGTMAEFNLVTCRTAEGRE